MQKHYHHFRGQCDLPRLSPIRQRLELGSTGTAVGIARDADATRAVWSDPGYLTPRPGEDIVNRRHRLSLHCRSKTGVSAQILAATGRSANY